MAEQLQHQIESESAKCCCPHKFKSTRVGEGKDGDLYYNFGESQKKYLVRILRSNVMVRVGGGWMSLVEFLGKYDPCRGEENSICLLEHRFILFSVHLKLILQDFSKDLR